MRIQVKICGVTTPACARAAADAGADAVGFVFSPSPRRVSVARALDIVAALPPFVTRVAVFHDPPAAKVAEVERRFRPDLVQSEPDPQLATLGRGRLLPVLHDGPDIANAGVRFRDRSGALGAVLLEAPGRGGRGVRPDWTRASALARRVPLVLAGGLDPDNVAEAIHRVRPVAVDVSSGVESRPGVKDPELVQRFVSAVRRAEAEIRRGGDEA